MKPSFIDDLRSSDVICLIYNIKSNKAIGYISFEMKGRHHPKVGQGMIDLNILEKGDNYKDLKRIFIIFVCTFDFFGEGRHIYTFENRCI